MAPRYARKLPLLLAAFLLHIFLAAADDDETSIFVASENIQAEHLNICRNDDIGYCVFENGGNYFSYCGDETFGPHFFRAVENKWCRSSMLDENICCGGGTECCQVRWKKVIVLMVTISVGITILLCFCCGIFACCCRGTKKTKRVIKCTFNTSYRGPEQLEDNLHPTCPPDGLVKQADGFIKRSDGSIEYPDGSILFADGSLQYPDGLIQCADGTVLRSGGHHYSDGFSID